MIIKEISFKFLKLLVEKMSKKKKKMKEQENDRIKLTIYVY